MDKELRRYGYYMISRICSHGCNREKERIPGRKMADGELEEVIEEKGR